MGKELIIPLNKFNKKYCIEIFIYEKYDIKNKML